MYDVHKKKVAKCNFCDAYYTTKYIVLLITKQLAEKYHNVSITNHQT